MPWWGKSGAAFISVPHSPKPRMQLVWILALFFFFALLVTQIFQEKKIKSLQWATPDGNDACSGGLIRDAKTAFSGPNFCAKVWIQSISSCLYCTKTNVCRPRGSVVPNQTAQKAAASPRKGRRGDQLWRLFADWSQKPLEEQHQRKEFSSGKCGCSPHLQFNSQPPVSA